MSDYNSIFTGTEIDDTISLIKYGIELESGTDLNTVFTPGWYYGLGTVSYSNRPIISRNFVLCVFPSADGSNTGERVGQLFITTGYTSTASSAYPSTMYVRGVRRTRSPTSGSYSYTNTGWTALATSTDISSLEDRITNSFSPQYTSGSFAPQYTCGTLHFTSDGGNDTDNFYHVIKFIPVVIKVYYIGTSSDSEANAQLCTVLTPPVSYDGTNYTAVNTIWSGRKTVNGVIAQLSKGETYYWQPIGSNGYYVYEVMGYKETTSTEKNTLQVTSGTTGSLNSVRNGLTVTGQGIIDIQGKVKHIEFFDSNGALAISATVDDDNINNICTRCGTIAKIYYGSSNVSAIEVNVTTALGTPAYFSIVYEKS